MLIVHRASRGDRLADGLAGVLAAPADPDPFGREVVAVPTRGVERWLAQRLSAVLGAGPGRRDGVCANVDFPFPATLVGEATAAAGGPAAADDPWIPARATWPLLEVVDASLDEPWLRVLAGHLGARRTEPDEARRSRRFSTVRHLADLYDRYAVHRPAMIRAWAAGQDTDGTGTELHPDVRWQAELWRALRAHVATPSPAERLEEACRQLRAGPDLVGLPARVSLFGLTRLPASYLDVLAALGTSRDVHLWLLHPSPALWASLERDRLPPGPPPRRRDDPTVDRVRNPLLATWGRDAREMQLVLAAGGATGGTTGPDVDAPATLLGRIQAAVRADRPPPGTEGSARPALDPDDRSLTVHACHGRARQVEVLRDAILHLLEDDPTLQPRDVIVMCPDIDAFAPLIQATFGPGEVAAGRDLHVRLADRSIRQTNPVFGATAALLDLAAGRMPASEVLDLVGRPPVRQRFGLDDDDLSRIDEWVRASGIRWGLDAASRAPYQLSQVGAGTWRAGLDRLLLGVAMSEDELRIVGGVLPFDDIDSGDIDLVGRLAELTDRLEVALASMRDSHPLAEWHTIVTEAADALFATTPADEWQRTQLRSVLDEVLAEATPTDHPETGPGGGPLTLMEVRTLLADRLRGRPTRANFRTGHLTMCTLVPMRSVPHRVVCLLGLDDGVFPRHRAPDGDDLLALDPTVGDRDVRSEDRQLLLDALLAAEDHLMICYSGRDERTNASRPPAVPVGELLDVVDGTVRSDDGRRARERIVVHHPLQPFDARNFRPGVLRAATPWSFDPVALAGAAAAGSARSAPPPVAAEPVPDRRRATLELDDLVRFVQQPVRAFLRQRLEVGLSGEWSEPGDGLPIELDALERWQIGDRLLAARRAGVDEATARRAETGRGALPPGQLGRAVLDALGPDVDALVAADPGGVRSSLDVVVDLGGGRTLVGTVTDVVGDEIRSVTYSRLAAKHRIAAWVRLLALSAGRPHQPWQARSIGRAPSRSRVATAVVGPVGAGADDRRAEAVAQLQVLVDLHDRGMRSPLPITCASTAAWCEAQRSGRDAVAAATAAWKSGDRFPGDDVDAAHVMVWEGVLPFAALLEARPEADETGPGWVEEATRFGRLAHRLWDGLLANERRT